MLNRLPVDVNPFRLVEQKKCLAGVLPFQQLPRLAEVALPESGDFAVELEFTRSTSGLPIVMGHVHGIVMLECQRCLQAMEFPIDNAVQVALTTFQSDERPEQEGFEAWLVEDDRLFLQDFIEDEILLALPLVARHEQCEPARELIEALPSDMAATQASQTDDDEPEGQKNPFAVLKDWKKTE
ncbi:YceD family protein [Candidatus Thiothrix sp. Deng01]|uniref:Large ribosomal RNA subunit accumulation protein YceD n=1 Tax=Candidatus Thiothrix phosphatis TaxID=3112415 RepID=A0ABU6CUW2_9GAMM|nr:YceD family protein [Candidatus Thiothrix sp. Deng01]MEB4589909.1 YceD family protein [Candidatus Thiothrix sp. Deng01]